MGLPHGLIIRGAAIASYRRPIIAMAASLQRIPIVLLIMSFTPDTRMSFTTMEALAEEL